MSATTTGLAGQRIEFAQKAPAKTWKGRRRITPQAGRALEILGHAIEYLTDEYVHEAKVLSAADPPVRAIQLLMALNREIYYECPRIPALTERLLALLRLGTR